MFAIVLLAIVASASAGIVQDGPCPEVNTVDNFNLKAFASGKWYEVGKYPNNKEKGASCGWAEYVLNGDIFSINNYDVANGKRRHISGSGRLADNAGTRGKLIFTYPYGPGGSNTENKVNILYNDDTTALIYHCEEKQDKKSHEDFSWIFSRSKTFEGTSKTSIEKTINDNSFLDYSNYVWTDFSEDACKYEA